VLQIGCGLGYYTAVLARLVGAAGRVVAFEVDESLAARAQENLAAYDRVDVRVGDGRSVEVERVDAILVHAGVTHPERSWLDALGPAGRLVLPLTCTFPALGSLGKGHAVLVTAAESPAAWPARLLGMVMIYSAVGLRDPILDAALGQALSRTPAPRLRRFRRDAHAAGPGCWFHQEWFCFSEG
jgi:protein-L-isoaspartate(D-aspartate) O-methyltransferase